MSRRMPSRASGHAQGSKTFADRTDARCTCTARLDSYWTLTQAGRAKFVADIQRWGGPAPGRHARAAEPSLESLWTRLLIRHWEVTARVQKAFLSVFWICLIFLIFLLTLREHAWVSWSVRRGRARSCEYVWIAQSHSGLVSRGRSRARPDLAVDSGSRRVRASLRDVSNEIELN
jgi:hypothetical protein